VHSQTVSALLYTSPYATQGQLMGREAHIALQAYQHCTMVTSLHLTGRHQGFRRMYCHCF